MRCWPSNSSPRRAVCPRRRGCGPSTRDTAKTDRSSTPARSRSSPSAPISPASDDHCRPAAGGPPQQLTSERRRTINRLHRHLRDLIAGGAQLNAKELLPRSVPATASRRRKQMARDLLVGGLDRALAQNRRRCEPRWPPAEPLRPGDQHVLAAKLPHRASAASPAPTASPATRRTHDVVRHRLSRHGNRQLNHAIHLAAHVQTIRPGPGRDYYQRRRDTGNEALRLLKRHPPKRRDLT